MVLKVICSLGGEAFRVCGQSESDEWIVALQNLQCGLPLSVRYQGLGTFRVDRKPSKTHLRKSMPIVSSGGGAPVDAIWVCFFPPVKVGGTIKGEDHKPGSSQQVMAYCIRTS